MPKRSYVTNDILDLLGSSKYFSVFDLTIAFHYIKIDPKDFHKTTFWIKTRFYNILKINGYYFNWINRNRTLSISKRRSYIC